MKHGPMLSINYRITLLITGWKVPEPFRFYFANEYRSTAEKPSYMDQVLSYYRSHGVI